MAEVAGIDGCRSGWVVVSMPAEGDAADARVTCEPDLSGVVAALDEGRLSAAAIDIPIGLPAVGPRRCDVEARKVIVPRHNSVFPAPSRDVLGAGTYREALSRSRAIGGKGLPKQTFAILSKIAAVDALMSPRRQERLVEAHPEVSFRLLAGRPLLHHKSNDVGRLERLAALETVFPRIGEQSVLRFAGAAPDDVLDAFACAWTARRWLAGAHVQLGGDLDERGLRMEIVG